MSYNFRLPTLPKGLSINADFKKAVEAAFEKHGVPMEAAQSVYDEVLGHFVTAHEKETAEAEAIAKQNSEFNIGILRDRWGDQFDAKWAAARDALGLSGLSEAAFEGMANQVGAANVIEQLAGMGERMNASRAQQPTQSRQHSPQNQAGDKAVENAAQQIRTLDRQVLELKNDPEFVERYTNPRHPMNSIAREQLQSLITRKAAAEKLVAGETELGSPRRAETLRAERDRLKKDPDFIRALNDQRDPRHTDVVKQWHGLMKDLAAADAPASKTSRRSEEVRREMDDFRRNKDVARILNTGEFRRTPAQEAEYRGAMDRHRALVDELGTAERQEAAAGTRAAAAGADQGGGE